MVSVIFFFQFHFIYLETIGKTAEVEDNKSKTRVIPPTAAARKSLRRIEPAKKSAGPSKTGVRPSDRLVQSDYGRYILNNYFSCGLSVSVILCEQTAQTQTSLHILTV